MDAEHNSMCRKPSTLVDLGTGAVLCEGGGSSPAASWTGAGSGGKLLSSLLVVEE